MGDILICPKCHERLWVGEMQIPLVTCPRCLARVINPNAGRDVVAREARPILPRQVIPLESEAEGDIWGTTMLLGIFAAALVGAGILLIKIMGMNGLSDILVVAGIAIGGLMWVLRRKAPGTEISPPPYLERAERSSAVLDYSDIKPKGSIGAFIGGFILAMGFCFFTMMAIFATSVPLNRALAIAAAVVGVTVCIYCAIRATKVSGNGGFYGGVTTGLVLGAMSCGPCSLMPFQ